VFVNPDPELLAGSGSGKNPGSSISEMNLKQNYSEKLIKLDNFSTKMINLKI
jgi:hypothetical protein